MNFSLSLTALFLTNIVFSQLTINTVKNLSFGSFCLSNNSSGSVSVSPIGHRTSTGGLILLNNTPYHMYAEIFFFQCDNKNVLVTYSNSCLLSSGNNNLTLNIGPTNLGSSGFSITT